MQQEARSPHKSLVVGMSTFPFAQAPIKMQIRTMKNCRLSIGPLPWFSYDGSSGYGQGIGYHDQERPLFMHIRFDSNALRVPPLDWKTTKIAGRLPLPPFFKIRIIPKQLSGWLCEENGEVQLEYKAEFALTWFRWHAPILKVNTVLSTSHITTLGQTGVSLDENGLGVLIGKATVPKTKHFLTDKFLRLPTEANAVMKVQITKV